MAIVTLIAGVVSTALGLSQLLERAASPELFDSVTDYRRLLTEGSPIALRATATAGGLDIAQFLAWGVARRRTALYRA